MPAITVRGVTLLPPRDTAPTNFKILVPVMANDLSNAAAAGAAGDVVELRLDALSILDAPNVQNVLCAARAAIGQDVPLLATIRTKKRAVWPISPMPHTANSALLSAQWPGGSAGCRSQHGSGGHCCHPAAGAGKRRKNRVQQP